MKDSAPIAQEKSRAQKALGHVKGVSSALAYEFLRVSTAIAAGYGAAVSVDQTGVLTDAFNNFSVGLPQWLPTVAVGVIIGAAQYVFTGSKDKDKDKLTEAKLKLALAEVVSQAVGEELRKATVGAAFAQRLDKETPDVKNKVSEAIEIKATDNPDYSFLGQEYNRATKVTVGGYSFTPADVKMEPLAAAPKKKSKTPKV